MLKSYDGWLQMPHPDHIVSVEESGATSLPLLEPVYPLTAGLTNTTLRKAIAQAFERLPALPEWIDAVWREQQSWPSFAEALKRLHAPEAAGDFDLTSPARTRLAYDELFANQLALAIIRQRLRRSAGRKLKAPGKLRQAILAALPFKLTRAQSNALAEIDADLAADNRMVRLLQGDVGAGKTVVALLAMASRSNPARRRR